MTAAVSTLPAVSRVPADRVPATLWRVAGVVLLDGVTDGLDTSWSTSDWSRSPAGHRGGGSPRAASCCRSLTVR